MDNHAEQMLREDMKTQMQSVSLPEDALTRIVEGHRRRKAAKRRLLAGGGAIGVVALAAILVFAVTLAQGGDKPSGAKVAVNRVASESTTTVVTDKKALAVTFLSMALASITPAEGEILHVKMREEHHVKSLTSVDEGRDKTGDITEEQWSTGDTKWMWRDTSWQADGTELDQLTDYTGRRLKYDYGPKVPTWADVVTNLLPRKPTKRPGDPDFMKSIRNALNSGQCAEDGHEQIEGRDAVRIISDGGTGPLLLMDAQTGTPLEQINPMSQGEYTIYYYDAYEILPGTAENLKVFDSDAFHPGVPVRTAHGA